MENRSEGMKVRDVMTPNPQCMPSGASIVSAAQVMRDQDIGDVLVADDNLLRGVVTDRDLVIRALASGSDLSSLTLADVCTEELFCVKEDATFDDAARLMADKAVRRVPVVNDNRLVGIVSLGDLALERDPDSVLGGISAAEPSN
jgi:CBS domain-containing protein